jgi:hypothetical protein
MNELTLISYSHSEYSDIWPLVIDGMRCIPKTLHTVFTCNNNNKDMTKIKEVYNMVLFYDDSLTYPQKLLYILSQITTPYVLLIHDIDICVNFDQSKIDDLMNSITENKIDRCMFGMIQRQHKFIKVNDMLLTDASKPNISRCFFTPYDVGVSIWNVKCLQECMYLFNNVSYRDIEYSGIQKYLETKSVWAFTPTDYCKPVFQIGRPYSNYFTFIHILIRGKWLDTNVYMDLKSEFNRLIDTYNIDIRSRGLIDGSHIQVNNFLV